MTKLPAVKNIPLNKLVLSPGNVRKTPPSAAAEAELEGQHQGPGLKTEPGRPPLGRREGRPRRHRRRAAAQGPAGARRRGRHRRRLQGAVPGRGRGRGARDLADGKHHPRRHAPGGRVRRHGGPDRCRRQSIEAVAARFGVPERHVRQRLRLGKLAPELLDAYRESDVGLEVMMAFTLGADHAAQLAVWRQVEDQSYIQPYTVKRLLTQSAVAARLRSRASSSASRPTRPPAARSTRDLFSGDDEGFMDDAALVRRLALEKLEQKAAELRSSWAWTRAMLDPAYDFTAQYGRVRPQPAELPPEIAGEIERIEERLAELAGNPRGRVDRRADHRSRPARGATRRTRRERRGSRGLQRERPRGRRRYRHDRR